MLVPMVASWQCGLAISQGGSRFRIRFQSNSPSFYAYSIIEYSNKQGFIILVGTDDGLGGRTSWEVPVCRGLGLPQGE